MVIFQANISYTCNPDGCVGLTTFLERVRKARKFVSTKHFLFLLALYAYESWQGISVLPMHFTSMLFLITVYPIFLKSAHIKDIRENLAQSRPSEFLYSIKDFVVDFILYKF